MMSYLTVSEPTWLGRPDTIAPLFITYGRFQRRKTPYPYRALVPYVIDSNGYMELTKHGRFRFTPREYLTNVIRYCDELGPPKWVAGMDHMCEDEARAMTGRTVRQHLEDTVANHVELERLWPELTDRPCLIRPTIQGYEVEDYKLCIRMYEDAGVDLRSYPIVGVGSVCRRQDTDEIYEVFGEISVELDGQNLHGYGVSVGGLRRYGAFLGKDGSVDTESWSLAARKREILLDECRDDPTVRHKNCNSCHRYAMREYPKIAAVAASVRPGVYKRPPRQLDLFPVNQAELEAAA